jgi:hypothetical protein
MDFPPDFRLFASKALQQAPSLLPVGTAVPLALDPLGPLAPLAGTWSGHGFNTIWRPSKNPQRDNILELNPTEETLVFNRIPGGIPNRGMVQGDITLAGLTYEQRISDTSTKDGIHIEPGIWVTVPNTTDPQEQPTVVRMASIPHGTTLLAQGVPIGPIPQPPLIDPIDISPFPIGSPNKLPKIHFPDETNLAVASPFRIPSAANPPGITQALVNNPNSLLTDFLATINIAHNTVLPISTNPASTTMTTKVGGGTGNIAFLVGANSKPNANAVSVEAIFWIIDGTLKAGGKKGTWLLYTQTVNLNFNGLTWPHVSVAALTKQP